jgi:hypothetical protein
MPFGLMLPTIKKLLGFQYFDLDLRKVIPEFRGAP